MRSFSRITRCILLALCLHLFVCFYAFPRELGQSNVASGQHALSDDTDLAAGIVDVGELKQTVINNGLLGTWGWSFYIIPELPAGWYKDYGYVPDINVWIGAPDGPWAPTYWDPDSADSMSMGPTVSEAALHGGTDQSDWGPFVGSLGMLHSGEAVVGDITPNSSLARLPLIATSTMPSSWPFDEFGQPAWPGPWGIDPQTGHITQGRFISDEDLFFSMTDGPYADRDDFADQGYPLHIQLDVSVHAYDFPYEDFIYYTASIINNSPHDYSGLYVGVFFDADIPEYNREEIVNDRFDWVGLNRELDLAYIYDYRWGTGDWPEVDPDAYKVHAGIQLLETPQDLGITDWHWFEWENRPGVLIPGRQEHIQYAVLSGDTTDLRSSEWRAYFHPNEIGDLDPHFDSYETVPSEFPLGFDCIFLMSTGPFNLAARDTTFLQWALVMGDDAEDLLANARLARELSENRLVRLHPKVEEIEVNVEQVALDTSEVTVSVMSYDPDGISGVKGYFESFSWTVVDSLQLFDDGLHGDGIADDSVFGNQWSLTFSTQQYFLHVISRDSLSYTTRVERAASFWAGLGVLPPFDLKAEGQEEKIYLRWSPNTDPATVGYNIYYDSDGPGPPYHGDDANQGRSPVAVPFQDDSTCVLSGLENGVCYYLNITAFDGSGHESGFPEEVSAVPGLHLPPGLGFRGLSRDNAVELDWSGYGTIAPADLKAFHIYRSGDLGLNYSRIASQVQMRYLDSDVTNGLQYLYYVSVEDSAENERLPGFPLEVIPVPETEGFPLEVGGEVDYFGATVTDIDGDGTNEIIVSNRDADGYALHFLELNGSELPGWPIRFDFPQQTRLTTRAVGDLDGDGECEIVAGSANYDLTGAYGVSVYAWHRDGSSVSGWPQDIPEAYFSAVALGDIDGDGDLEIIAGSSNSDLSSGAVYVWHHDGTIVFGWPKMNERFGFSHPTMGDLDEDGFLDLIFASDSLYVWDYSGASLDGWPQPCDVSYNSPLLGDIDGDGSVDVVLAALAGIVYAWDKEGTLFAGWPVFLGGAMNFYSALGDVDDDSAPEFVVPPFMGSGLFVVDSDGSVVGGAPLQVPKAQWYAFPRVADVDGQEGLEILAEVRNIQNGAFSIYAWRPDGTTLFGWPITTFGSNYDATICDVDKNGMLDMVTAQGPYVMSYSPGHPFDPDKVVWGTTHHDLYQTNNYGFEHGQTAVQLRSFSVLGRTNAVTVQWSLSGDSDGARFTISRAERFEGPFLRIEGEIEEKDRKYLFLDEGVLFGSTYFYTLDVVTLFNERKRFGPIQVEWIAPDEFTLYQNHPNPFNPRTTIRYAVPLSMDRTTDHSSLVTLTVYNILGQRVRKLVEERQEPGYYTATWDGRNDSGDEVSSGVYFYRLSIDSEQWSETKSTVLLR